MPTSNPGCLTSFLRIFGLDQTPVVSHKRLPADPLDDIDIPDTLPYFTRDDFLSPAEASFFHVIQSMLAGKQLIFPKVSLGDIFYVSHPNQNFAFINKINRKHVDFLLCDPSTLKPTMGVELDDSSHNRPDRQARDEFVDAVFKAAGLHLVHIPVRASYSSAELLTFFRDTYSIQQKPEKREAWASDEAPFCPKCGERMQLRTANRGAQAGTQFYGCPNYPKCRQVIPIQVKL